MYLLSFRSDGTSARSVDSTSCTAAGSMPACFSAAAMIVAMAWLEWNASFPPRRMIALPLLTHRAAASLVTFGRLS
jgi:hypothetical protein